jgi:phosphate starvation-inducible protein PhoH
MSSLSEIVRMFSNQEEIGVMEFERQDIVRNPLIIKMEEIFDENEERKG